MPSPIRRFKRLRRGRFDRIGNGDEPGGIFVRGEKHHRGAVAAKTVGVALQRSRIDAELGHEIRAAERDLAAL